MNRQELEKKLRSLVADLLREKGHVSYPDVFVALGSLDPGELEAWRFRRVPFLEKVVRMNLSRISFVMRHVRAVCREINLKPSRTAYRSWGKGHKQTLRFSKTGAAPIEELWATHFVGLPQRKADPCPLDPATGL